MSKVIETLSKNTSAFRHMAVCAILIGVGDVLCAVTDLGWLIGDMLVQVHIHHWFVLAGLSVANVLILISFIWLVKSIITYVSGHDKKVSEKRKAKVKVAKQSTVIAHLNKRIKALEDKVGAK